MKMSNEGLKSRQDSDGFVLFWAWKKSENTRERKNDWQNKVLMEVVSLTHYILVEHGNQRDPSEIGQIMALLCSKLSMTFQFIQNKRRSPYNSLPHTTWSSVTPLTSFQRYFFRGSAVRLWTQLARSGPMPWPSLFPLFGNFLPRYPHGMYLDI